MPAGFDASRPNIARVYDFWLGGKDNYAADRAVADQMIASLPAIQVGVRAQRDVLGRVVRYLTGEAGLRQFLDIGEPGLVRVPEWRPAMAIDANTPAQMWAGVALKPALKP